MAIGAVQQEPLVKQGIIQGDFQELMPHPNHLSFHDLHGEYEKETIRILEKAGKKGFLRDVFSIRGTSKTSLK